MRTPHLNAEPAVSGTAGAALLRAADLFSGTNHSGRVTEKG